MDLLFLGLDTLCIVCVVASCDSILELTNITWTTGWLWHRSGPGGPRSNTLLINLWKISLLVLVASKRSVIRFRTKNFFPSKSFKTTYPDFTSRYDTRTKVLRNGIEIYWFWMFWQKYTWQKICIFWLLSIT